LVDLLDPALLGGVNDLHRVACPVAEMRDELAGTPLAHQPGRRQRPRLDRGQRVEQLGPGGGELIGQALRVHRPGHARSSPA
jgi:hypothetical protein